VFPDFKGICLTPDEIDSRIAEREAQAISMPAGGYRRQLREEIARLHIYAGMKRLTVSANELAN
jgi:hypothetical protein